MKKLLYTLVCVLALGTGIWTLAVTFSPVSSSFSAGAEVSAAAFNSLFTTINDNFNTAKTAIDTNATNISALSSPAGVEFAVLPIVEGLGAPTSIMTYGNITLNAPSDGFAILTLTGGASFFGNDYLRYGLSNNATTYSIAQESIGGSNDIGGRAYSLTMSITKVVPVSAGNHTYYANANKFVVDIEEIVNLGELQLTALFVPNRY